MAVDNRETTGDTKSDAMRRKSQMPTFSLVLSWPHYRELMLVKRLEARRFMKKKLSRTAGPNAHELEQELKREIKHKLDNQKNEQ